MTLLVSFSLTAEELKKPDFVLPESLVRGQIDQTIGLKRESLLLPSPLSSMTMKETPLAAPQDPLEGRLKSLPEMALPPSLQDRLADPRLTRQDRAEEWWAGYGLFDQWLAKGLLARQWDHGRFLMSLEHARQGGRTAWNGRISTDGLLDVQISPFDKGLFGVNVGVKHALTNLPYASSLPLSEWERLTARATLTGGWAWTPHWRSEVTAGWQTTRFVKEGLEDLLMQAKWSHEFSLEGLKDHRWFMSTRLRNDSAFGTVGFVSLEDRIRNGLWTWHVGGRLDGSFVGALAHVFYTAAPQTTVFLKFEPRQEYPVMGELAFSPYAEALTGLKPTRVPFAATVGVESTVITGMNMKGEVGFERTEDWLVWEDLNGNALFETVFLPEMNWVRPRLTVDWDVTSSWTSQVEYRMALPAGMPAGFSFLPHTPQYQASWLSSFKWNPHLVGVEIMWVGPREGNRTGTVRLAPYLTATVRGETPLIDEWFAWIRLDNVLNAHYQERAGYDELPFRGMVGIKGRW